MGHPNEAKTREQKLSRSEQAWEHRRQGKSLRTIGKAMGISHAAVKNLLADVYARRTKELDDSVGEYKLEQLDRLEFVVEEAITAWHKSKLPEETNKTVTKKNGAKTDPLPKEPDSETEITGMYLDDNGDEVSSEEKALLLRAVGLQSDGGIMLTTEETTTNQQKGQTGNPAHLTNVLNALKAQRDILGIDAPRKQQVDIKSLTNEQIIGLLEG